MTTTAFGQSNPPEPNDVVAFKEDDWSHDKFSFSSTKREVPADHGFPRKLHQMLADSEAEGTQSIFSWLPNGKAFRIHNRPMFVSTVLPKYYQIVNIRSFLRQLNLYGFQRATNKNRPGEFGSYSHPFFLRSDLNMCSLMTRKVKSRSKETVARQSNTPNIRVIHSSENEGREDLASGTMHLQRDEDTTDYLTPLVPTQNDGESMSSREAEMLSELLLTSFHQKSSSCRLIRCVTDESKAMVIGEESTSSQRDQLSNWQWGESQDDEEIGWTTSRAADSCNDLSSTLAKIFHRHQGCPLPLAGGSRGSPLELEEMQQFKRILSLFLPKTEALSIEQKSPTGLLESGEAAQIERILADLEPQPVLPSQS